MVAARGSAEESTRHPASQARAVDEPDLCPMEGGPRPEGDEGSFPEAPGAEADREGEPMVLKEDEDEEECAPVRLAPEPGEPTAEEIEQHRTTHLPYRTWCEECVMGRGSGEQHRSGPAGTIPVVACDYLLVTRHGILRREELAGSSADILMKILVVKDTQSKFIGAHVVPAKGLGEDRYAAEKIRRDVLWLGYSRIVLKSDN